MSKICQKCHTQNDKNLVYCTYCGYCFHNPSQSINLNSQPSQYYQPPKERGKGFGIASLILGIVTMGACLSDIFLTLCMFLVNKELSFLGTVYSVQIMLFSVLAIIFAIVAIKKGYKNKISKAGLIMGIIGLAIGLISLIVSIQII